MTRAFPARSSRRPSGTAVRLPSSARRLPRASGLWVALTLLLACAVPALAAPATTSVTLAITTLAGTAVSSVPSGTAVTLTATLTSTAGTPYPGQVIFCDATAVSCQNASLGLAQVVNSGGTAKATLSFTPGPGSHSYKAVFLGTRTYAKASSQAQSLNVPAAIPTTTTLSTTGSAGSYSLAAQISAAGPQASPTGSVSFLDTTTNATLGSAPITPGSIPAHFSLASGVSSTLANSPATVRGLTTGDFNGDGKLDVAIHGSPLSIQLGNGDGTFHAAPSPAINAVYSVVTGDFNNDGKLDLVVAPNAQGPVTLLLGNGDGTFVITSPSLSVCKYPEDIRVGDVNNDGNADLVISCEPLDTGLNPTFMVLLGNGDGTFAASTFAAPVTLYSNIVLADFDEDGYLDIATSGPGLAAPYSPTVSVFLGNGDGTFQTPTSTVVGLSPSSGFLVAADFNGDGLVDLALSVTTQTSPSISTALGVLLSNGSGTFAAPVLTPLPGTSSILDCATLDLNGDTNADLAVIISGGSSLLFSSNGDGTFNLAAQVAVSANYLATGDLNSDGVPDILTTKANVASVVSYLITETHNSAATLSNIAAGGSGTHTVSATYSGDAAYTPSTSSAASLAATIIPTTLTLASTSSGTQIALTATLTPASLGNLTANSDIVTFTGGATTLGTAPLSSGAATLTLTSLPAGVSAVTAIFGGDANFAASSAPAIQVAAPPPGAAVILSASSLTFSSQPLASPSAAQTITLTNTGQAPLTIASLAATGDFAQTSTCTSGPVAPLGTCTISVTFTPVAAGPRTGTITLSDNAANSPQTISLAGNGAAVPITLNLAITSAGNPVSSVPSGTAVTLTAVLTATSGTPYPGQVIFCETTAAFCSNASLGLAQVVHSGTGATASITLVPGPGTHSYKALFLGTRIYPQASSSPQPLAVTASIPTTTSLTSTGSAGSYNLAAQVSGTGPYLGPSGTVSFVDNATSATLGRASFTPGSAEFSVATGTMVTLDNTQAATKPVIGDFNGDGKLDMAVGNLLDNAPVHILLGNGDGNFRAGPSLTVSGTVVLAADFNNDGKLDLIVADTNSGVATTATLLLGNGDGTFTSATTTVIPPCASMAVGDLNNDGNADLVVNCGGTSFTVLLGNGDGTFVSSTLPLSGFYSNAVAIGDFDGDGNADLVATDFPLGSGFNIDVAFFHGNGDGTFQAPVASAAGAATGGVGFFLAADFNGDGKLDIAIRTPQTVTPQGPSGSAVGVMLNNGDGTFASPVITPAPGHDTIESAVPVDLNGDGKADIGLLGSSSFSLLLSNGDGTFTAVPTAITASGISFVFITPGDFNGDGVPDFVMVNGNFDQATPYLTTETHHAVAILSNLAVGGSGTHTITATYSGDAAYAASTSTGVSLTATVIPTTLTIAANPASATSGSPIALKATLTPASLGNLATDGQAITFSNGSTSLGTATLLSGVATLNTSALPAGTDSVTATFSGNANFAASAAPPVQVTIAVPLLPAVTLSGATLTYPLQGPGSPSAAQTITVTNSGQAPLSFTSITATGDFAQTNTCTAVIPVQRTCTISVTFTPTAAGVRTGTLTLADNAANSPQAVSLTGTGAPVSLTPAASSLFIANPGGSASTTLQIAAAPGFSGAVALTCAVTSSSTTSALLPTCALNPAQGSVSPGSPFSSTLTISTTAATARLSPPAPPGIGKRSGIALAGILFAVSFVTPGRRSPRLFALLAVFGLLAGLSGCGGHSTSSGSSTPGTPAGTYQVTISATANSVTVPTTLNLTVQ